MPALAAPAQLRLLKGRSEGKDSAGRPVAPPPAFRRIAPNPPAWLSREARAEWRRVVPGLARLDLLKEEDRAGLAAYCEAWATFVAATRQVQREGVTTIGAKGGVIQHPAVTVARTASAEMRAWVSHFGLSPAAEGKLMAKDPDDGEDDVFS